jgi:probable HAF family extracellular repeat protein
MCLAVTVFVLVGASAARAQARAYPYTLVDPGTFAGPGSFAVLPGVPITSNGTVVGTADTTTRDSDKPVDPSCACDGYVDHAFKFTNGHLVDLGALAPAADNNSAIAQLNGNGVGAGQSENGLIDPVTGLPAHVAVVFEHGRVIGLGTLGGGHESGSASINSQGQVAGFSTNSTRDPFPREQQQYYVPFVDEIRGFVWRNGVMHGLGTLGGPDAFPIIQNQRGQIAGWSDTNSTANATTHVPTIDPFLWQNGHMTDLGSLGGTLGFVNWLNDKGEVVGQSNLAGDRHNHPFLWRGGRMTDLGTLGGHFGAASYVNNRGDVAGWSTTKRDQSLHGFLWHHGKLTDLHPVGAAFAFTQALNDRDQVVGNEFDAHFNPVIAALWVRGHGYDLNKLVAPSSFQMISANYITNKGEIFGQGVYTSGPNAGDGRVFVLMRNPSVPLPAAPNATRRLTKTSTRNAIALALRLAHHDRLARPMSQLSFGQSP